LSGLGDGMVHWLARGSRTSCFTLGPVTTWMGDYLRHIISVGLYNQPLRFTKLFVPGVNKSTIYPSGYGYSGARFPVSDNR